MRYLPGAIPNEIDEDGYVKVYDENDPAFKEYVKSITPFSGRGDESKTTTYPSKPRNRKGYVYLLRVLNETSLYKIGRATDVNNRLRTFNVKLPFQVEYECVIESGDMYRLERELHRLFESKRLNGEFFRLEQHEVDYIISLSGAI